MSTQRRFIYQLNKLKPESIEKELIVEKQLSEDGIYRFSNDELFN